MLNRAEIRARIFPLAQEGREDPTAFASVDERLALVGELTREMWALSGWEIPAYSRAEIPVVVKSLDHKE